MRAFGQHLLLVTLLLLNGVQLLSGGRVFHSHGEGVSVVEACSFSDCGHSHPHSHAHHCETCQDSVPSEDPEYSSQDQAHHSHVMCQSSLDETLPACTTVSYGGSTGEACMACGMGGVAVFTLMPIQEVARLPIPPPEALAHVRQESLYLKTLRIRL